MPGPMEVKIGEVGVFSTVCRKDRRHAPPVLICFEEASSFSTSIQVDLHFLVFLKTKITWF